VSPRAKDGNNNEGRDNEIEPAEPSDSRNPSSPKTPTSPMYNITLAPLSPEVLANTGSSLQAPGIAPGITLVSVCSVVC